MSRPDPVGLAKPSPGDGYDRRLGRVLWALLGIATLVFWAAVPGAADGSAGELTGRRLLEGLPLPALVAGGTLLLVFVASVTLRTRAEPWLPGAALGSALVALHTAPVALGRGPEPVGGTPYREAAGLLAETVGLDGPGPLLRWAPLVCQLLCLVPLWLLLASAGRRLSWQGRWGALYLLAVGAWVWRDALAPVAPPLLALLVVLHTAVVLVPLPSLRGRRPSGRPED